MLERWLLGVCTVLAILESSTHPIVLIPNRCGTVFLQEAQTNQLTNRSFSYSHCYSFPWSSFLLLYTNLLEINESGMKLSATTVAHFINLICSLTFWWIFCRWSATCVFGQEDLPLPPPPLTGGADSPDFGRRKKPCETNQIIRLCMKH
jgi:hypothetical protein